MKINSRNNIYKFIEQKIITREWPKNYKLMSENQFCLKFNVSRSLIREILKQLKKDGFLISSPGRGYFINPSKYWSKNISDSKRFLLDVQNTLLKKQVPLPDWFIENHNLKAEDFTSFIKLRKMNNKIFDIVYIFLNNKMITSFNYDEINKSVVDYLKKNFDFNSSYSFFKVEHANKFDIINFGLNDENNKLICKYSIIYHNKKDVIQCAVSKKQLDSFTFGYEAKV